MDFGFIILLGFTFCCLIVLYYVKKKIEYKNSLIDKKDKILDCINTLTEDEKIERHLKDIKGEHDFMLEGLNKCINSVENTYNMVQNMDTHLQYII